MTTRPTLTRLEELRSKTTMNRMSEGPSAQSHRTNSEVLELFAEIRELRDERDQLRIQVGHAFQAARKLMADDAYEMFRDMAQR